MKQKISLALTAALIATLCAACAPPNFAQPEWAKSSDAKVAAGQAAHILRAP